MGFMPVNTILAKKQVATLTAPLYKSAAPPVGFIDLDKQHHVGQVLNTYFLLPACQKLQTQTIPRLPECLLKYEANQ